MQALLNGRESSKGVSIPQWIHSQRMWWGRNSVGRFAMVLCVFVTCADPGIFVRVGGPGQKSSDNGFFLVLRLFYRSQMVNFKEIYHFSRFQRGPTFSRGGGSNFFQGGGSNCFFPIETHITCDFPGGPDPLSPLWIRTCLKKASFILVSIPWFYPGKRRIWGVCIKMADLDI